MRQAILEDWPSLSACWEKFKLGPDAAQVDGGPGSMRSFFQVSLVVPQCCILVLVEEAEVRGFAILTENQATQARYDGSGAAIITHGFVRGIHIQPGAPLRSTLEMEQAICAWGRSRNHPFLTGYCSEEYFNRAENPYKRLGWHKSHIVVSKSLQEVQNHGR